MSRFKARKWWLPFLFLGCAHNGNLNEGKSPATLSLDTGINHAEVIQILKAEGGFTFHKRRGDLAGTGLYAVSAYPERHVRLKRFPTAADIKAFVEANNDLLREESNNLGGWCEGGSSGPTCYLDISRTLKHRSSAVKLGGDCNQMSIAYLGKEKVEFIETGGTGSHLVPGTAAFEVCRQSRDALLR